MPASENSANTEMCCAKLKMMGLLGSMKAKAVAPVMYPP